MFDYISTGRYWDKPWTLVSGCTRCSPGCDHCWALAMEHRFKKKPYFKPVWAHLDRLDIPLRRKKPTVWAIWNDLFHEDVPLYFISDALNIIHACPQHTFLILTKRAKRLSAMWSSGVTLPGNLWLGVTVCNQQEADEKIPLLLQIPAAVRWGSIEPMLGPVDIRPFLPSITWEGIDRNKPSGVSLKTGISGIVLGGETGPGARPMHPDWPRKVRDDCQAAGVPFMFKGWGKYCRASQMPQEVWNGMVRSNKYLAETKDESYNIGKAAGRLLDGREWSELPEIKG